MGRGAAPPGQRHQPQQGDLTTSIHAYWLGLEDLLTHVCLFRPLFPLLSCDLYCIPPVCLPQDCPEFDLVFDNAFDQWVASSAAEKCIFIQIMYHACQTYWEGKEGVPGSPAGDQQKAPGGQSSPGAQGGQMGGPGPQARRKSTVGPRPRHTEFVNCQSKLTGGKGVLKEKHSLSTVGPNSLPSPWS